MINNIDTQERLKKVQLGKVRSDEKLQRQRSPSARQERGIRFIRDIKMQFDNQYVRIPFGPDYKRTSFVHNPFRVRQKTKHQGEYIEADPKQRALTQQKARRHREKNIFIGVGRERQLFDKKK